MAVGAGVIYLKHAVDATNDLAKATASLTRTTGLDSKEASAWVSVLESRGIAIDQFQASITRLSTLMEKARTTQIALAQATANYIDAEKRLAPALAKDGDARKQAVKDLNKFGAAVEKAATAAGKAEAPFKTLGVNMADVRKGNTGAVLLQLADGFKQIENPATRAATAQAIFGRQGKQMLPILMAGSKGLKEQMALAEKYNLTLSKDQVESAQKAAKAQRELKMAQKGVAVTIGAALLPAQAELYGSLNNLVGAIFPMIDNTDLMKVGLVAYIVVLGAAKIATIALAIASSGLTLAMLPTIAIVAAIVIGIAALIAIGYLLYKNWDKVQEIAGTVWKAVKKATSDTLDWFKRNWPYILGVLTGPFGLAIALIYKHWDAIKRVFSDAITWGKSIGNAIKDGIVNGLLGIGNAAWGVINNIWEVVYGAGKTILGWGKYVGTTIKDGVVAGVEGIGALLVGAFRAAINAVIRLWNSLPSLTIDPPGPGPKFKIKFPKIPALAKGGIVTGPTLAMVGEKGPEMVVPFGRRRRPHRSTGLHRRHGAEGHGAHRGRHREQPGRANPVGGGGLGGSRAHRHIGRTRAWPPGSR